MKTVQTTEYEYGDDGRIRKETVMREEMPDDDGTTSDPVAPPCSARLYVDGVQWFCIVTGEHRGHFDSEGRSWSGAM